MGARQPGGDETYTLNDGTVIDALLPVQRKANLYQIDRGKQKTENYTGINGIGMQDRAMTEGMSFICDRTQEHLGTTDIAIIAARRRLLKAASDLEQGIEPFGATHPDLYQVRSMDLVSPEPELTEMLDVHGAEALAPAYG